MYFQRALQNKYRRKIYNLDLKYPPNLLVFSGFVPQKVLVGNGENFKG
jgi:hypothetical protein